MGNCSFAHPLVLPVHPSSMHEIASAISETKREFASKHIRDLLGHVKSVEDIAQERVNYLVNSNPTLIVSMLKDMGLYKLDWGRHLGFAESIRMASSFANCIPRVLPMPMRRDGSMDILVWIERTAMNRLRRDEVWCKIMKEPSVSYCKVLFSYKKHLAKL